jgi:hypothetical protein
MAPQLFPSNSASAGFSQHAPCRGHCPKLCLLYGAKHAPKRTAEKECLRSIHGRKRLIVRERSRQRPSQASVSSWPISAAYGLLSPMRVNSSARPSWQGRSRRLGAFMPAGSRVSLARFTDCAVRSSADQLHAGSGRHLAGAYVRWTTLPRRKSTKPRAIPRSRGTAVLPACKRLRSSARPIECLPLARRCGNASSAMERLMAVLV